MQIAEINAGLAQLIARYGAELGPLPEEALDRRPADGGWSAREVIGHLTRTVELYNRALGGLVGRTPVDGEGAGVGAAAQDEPRATLVGRLLLGLLRKEGARKKKVSSPKVFRPDREERVYDVAGLVAAHEALLGYARNVEAQGLGVRKIATPISGLLRLRAQEALEVQLLHGHRHLEQARRAASA